MPQVLPHFFDMESTIREQDEMDEMIDGERKNNKEYHDTRKYNAFVNAMLLNGYKIAKLSTMAGYISRKLIALIQPYEGKFGKGYIVHKPRYDNTGYHDIYYLVKNVNNAEKR